MGGLARVSSSEQENAVLWRIVNQTE